MLITALSMLSCKSNSKMAETERRSEQRDSVVRQEVVEQEADTEIEVIAESVEIIQGGDTTKVQRMTKRTKSTEGVKVETLKKEVKDSTSSITQIEEKKETASHGSQKRGVGLKWYAFGCMTCFFLIAILIVFKHKSKVR